MARLLGWILSGALFSSIPWLSSAQPPPPPLPAAGQEGAQPPKTKPPTAQPGAAPARAENAANPADSAKPGPGDVTKPTAKEDEDVRPLDGDFGGESNFDGKLWHLRGSAAVQGKVVSRDTTFTMDLLDYNPKTHIGIATGSPRVVDSQNDLTADKITIVDAGKPEERKVIVEGNPHIIHHPEKPEKSAPDKIAPDDNAPDKNAPDKNAPDKNAPDKNAPDKNAPDKNAPDKNAPDKNAPDKNAPDKNAPDKNAPDKTAPDNDDENAEVLRHDIVMTCDHLEYFYRTKAAIAQGHVFVVGEDKQNGKPVKATLTADRLEVDEKNNTYTATGSVVMVDGDRTVTTPKAVVTTTKGKDGKRKVNTIVLDPPIHMTGTTNDAGEEAGAPAAGPKPPGAGLPAAGIPPPAGGAPPKGGNPVRNAGAPPGPGPAK